MPLIFLQSVILQTRLEGFWGTLQQLQAAGRDGELGRQLLASRVGGAELGLQLLQVGLMGQ
jgi:hypothetical protein